MPLFFAVSFISGLAAILTPCIWPLLPIVLSTSVTNNKLKPVGTVLGIITSFSIFSLSISFLITSFGLNVENLRKFAAIILFMLGLTLTIPYLSSKIEVVLSILSSKLPIKMQDNYQSGFVGGYLTGLVLGIVWSPCAVPILAIVAAISATQTITTSQILIVITFALGLAIPLLILTLSGTYLFQKVRIIARHTGRVQQILGLITIATAFMIFFNWDRQLQAKILDLFPSYSNFLGKIESLK